ncbi:MAG: nitrite reductase small subunit NirD [Bryobacteraceae bacterium]
MNSQTKWIRITAAADIPVREGRPLRLGNHEIAVFNLGDRFVAVDNRCPHSGGPLADGIVGGANVTCPLHNWRICLESGVVTKPCDTAAPAVRTYPVRVEDGIVLLGMDEAVAAA